MRTLEVYLGEAHIGQIVETRKGGRFAYDLEVIERHAGMPLLSLALPVKKKPFSEAKTSNWFNGLLPEGSRRDAVAKSFGISPYDWIGLLAKIGWECAGAVRIFETGSEENIRCGYEALPSEGLREKLIDASARIPDSRDDSLRMSLGGFQEKLCLALPKSLSGGRDIDANAFSLPLGSAPSTHILKPENAKRYPGSAESEAWAMCAASRAARCSQVGLLRMENAPDTLVIERYDRKGSQLGSITRLHQEDVCQALGLPPERKYANAKMPKGDDPTYEGIAELLSRFSENPEEELKELLRQLVVNMALGNWDAHAKNTSLIYKEPFVPSVAPLYDVVPIAEVEPRTNALSMRVGGCIKPGEVGRTDLLHEAGCWGLLEAVADTVVDECLSCLEEGVHAASLIYPMAAKRHEAHALARIERLS